MHCIFCENELNENTKPEHILPNALGGRKTTRRVICSECNNVFGSSIDKNLTSQVEEIRNMLQLKSGTGKTPPMLRNIQSGTGTVNFRNDGTPELTGKPFVIDYQDDGSVAIQISAQSEEEFQKLVPNIAAQIGISVEEFIEQIKPDDISQISKPLDTVHHRLNLGGIEALRSITKTCLVLWCTKVGNEEVNSTCYEDARQFVTEGEDHFNKNSIYLDSRFLPCDTGLRERFGEVFNLVYLKSDATGRLIGHFTLYNAISWQIVLVESGAVPDISIGLASNPLNSAEWSDTVADKFNVDFNWLDNPNYDDWPRVQERFSTVVKLHLEEGRPREIGKIVNEVCDRHNISEDDPIPDELREQIIAEIANRTAHYALRFPHERSLSPAEIKALLDIPL